MIIYQVYFSFQQTEMHARIYMCVLRVCNMHWLFAAWHCHLLSPGLLLKLGVFFRLEIADSMFGSLIIPYIVKYSMQGGSLIVWQLGY